MSTRNGSPIGPVTGFSDAAPGRSNQLAVFLDDRGRSYSLPAHTLPSARGQGEPLTGRLQPPDGARFVHVLCGDADKALLLASDSGYGFLTRLGNLHTAESRQGGAEPGQ